MRTLIISVILLISNLLFAQQRIVFEKIHDNFKEHLKYEYNLPVSVTCTFTDGTKKRLVLEKVKGDSLIFRKYYNQNENYDCVLSSVTKIRIHKYGENFLYTLFGLSSISTPVITTFSIILWNSVPVEAGASDQLFGAILIPVAVITAATAIISAKSLPRNFELKRWKMYAK